MQNVGDIPNDQHPAFAIDRIIPEGDFQCLIFRVPITTEKASISFWSQGKEPKILLIFSKFDAYFIIMSQKLMFSIYIKMSIPDRARPSLLSLFP